ncbi:Cna B-type [Scytonema sp. UIC 10036]|uniref:carboxypeptidase-like regulatory domain-containing protein n=1 Tax=Scytonema sp. UIC 10036 TaxID=2304196 RepID=UPI0012DAC370|nr:carboxypeptidase-like regulatory domain-containing protein [Scytonema sp. UIC 10036]MUH00129.1 Cna B-type [Scytonema sp. UIC 10036]
MLYLALPPVPPPIIITLPPQKTADETPSTENTLSTTQSTETSSQNSGIASAATAQPLPCKPLQAQPQSSSIEEMLKKMASSQGKTVDCKPQEKKFDVLSLQARLRKQKPAKGFFPITKAPTSANNNLPLVRSSVSEEQPKASVPLSIMDRANSASPDSSEQLESQKPSNTLAFDKSAEKNAIQKILVTVQELINFSLSASLKSSIDSIVPANTQNSQIIASTPQVASANPQPVATAPLTNTNGVNSTNTPYNEKPNTQSLTSTLNQIANKNAVGKILAAVQKLIELSLPGSLQDSVATNTQSPQAIANSRLQQGSDSKETIDSTKVATQGNSSTGQVNNSGNNSGEERVNAHSSIELARTPGEPFLVGVLINGREVGTLDVIQEGNTLLIPLESFAEIAGLTVEETDNNIQLKTPLGVIKLSSLVLKQINGITYISNATLREQLRINIELNTAELTLLADLPWRAGSRQYQGSAEELKPEFLPPASVLSTLRQELSYYNTNGDSSLRSSTLVGGRLLGWSWRLRLNNTFEDRPEVSEYFLYRRNGPFRFQLGRQQVGLHPLLNGLDLTGLQFGYTNLPADRFSTGYDANELLPRRSTPIQTFRGQAAPASFVQLRVDGVIIAQQQVGFNGQYEFLDVNLPVGQSSEVQVYIFDRSNLSVPREIRTVRLNPSDLLLPAGGNIQVAGVGFSGNLAQNTLFGESNLSDEGKLVGFYQLRQGLSNNLTLEGSVQAAPDALQTQAGFIWRLANPMILSASAGTSGDKVGYSADLDVQLDKLEINANSQSLPRGYRRDEDTKGFHNHSLEVKYRFGNKYTLGFIARDRQDESNSSTYILPTFAARPFSSLYFSGRPDVDGRYLFNAFYQPNSLTRLTFNAYGNEYISDLSYKFARNYQLSFGTEFGGDLASRYSVSVGHNPSNLNKLSWNVGLAYSDGDIGPIAGASMQVLPGLLARFEYQGIPTRARTGFGGVGDDRLTLSLISDLSFGGGRIAPTNYSGIGKERGAIAGRLVVEGENKGFDLSGTVVRIFDNRNKNVGSTRTDSKGNFFVGNLPEGVYVVQLEPEELPIELTVMKNSAVAEVATSAVTSLDFPVRPEFGVAGRVTDIAGQPVSQLRVELINGAGARVLSAVTDSFGLYRLDGVPIGFYTLRVSTQDSLNPNDTLPKREIQIRNQFVYEQNLQLPISAASKKKQ